MGSITATDRQFSNLCFAVEVDAFAEGGLEENIVEGQLGESAGEDFDLRGHVEAVIENDALFTAHDAQPPRAAHEVFAGDGNVQAIGEGFEFLKELGIGHGINWGWAEGGLSEGVLRGHLL